MYKVYSRSKSLKYQDKILRNLINTCQSTLFGKEHGFDEITGYKQYKNAVKVQPLNESKYGELMLDNKPDIVSRGTPDFIIRTTGTVTPKKLPSNLTMMKYVQNAGKDLLVQYAIANHKPGVFLGKSLSLLGTSRLVPEGEFQMGDIGGIMFHTRPKFINKFMLPSLKVNSIEEFIPRVDAIIDEVIGQPIKTLISQPLWLEVFNKRLILKTGKGIKENFPDLIVFCSGGVHLEPFRKRLVELLGKNVDILDNYIASEGYIAFQNSTKQKDLFLLTNYGIFYEFINQKTKERVSLEKVQLNTAYEIVVTTQAGLWAQPMGDIIEFTSLDPFKIRLKGRSKDFINLATEKVIASEVAEAISNMKQSVVDFTVSPKIDSKGAGYEFYIESRDTFTNNDIKLLDSFLSSVNFKYKVNREDLKILAPTIHILKLGAFEKALTKLDKIGGQNKVPKIKSSSIFSKHLTDCIEYTLDLNESK